MHRNVTAATFSLTRERQWCVQRLMQESGEMLIVHFNKWRSPRLKKQVRIIWHWRFLTFKICHIINLCEPRGGGYLLNESNNGWINIFYYFLAETLNAAGIHFIENVAPKWQSLITAQFRWKLWFIFTQNYNTSKSK